MPIGKEGNVKWVDGLRGVASVLVVATHLTRSFEPDLFSSTTTQDSAPRLLQLPYLRILIQGRIGVTIFAFVTGYVCALKPIKLYRQGQQELALLSISKSSLRRFPRLFLPATAATLLSWLMAQLGCYDVAERTDSWWVSSGTPQLHSSWGKALYMLMVNIITTWTAAVNLFDANQWTLLPLVRGSIWVYAFMVATGSIKPKYRMLISWVLWFYFFLASDSTFGMQFFWGVLLADLQNIDTFNAIVVSRPRISALFSSVFLFIGLTYASFPEAHAEWMTWSRLLLDFMRATLPLGHPAPDYGRFGSGLGLNFATLGIVLSPSVLQRALASKYLLFFGRMSFAVYLLHGTLIRTTLVWMLYGIHTPPLPEKDESTGQTPAAEKLTFPGDARLLAWLVIWLPMLYGLAYLWTAYVDLWCERMTTKLVEWVRLGEREKSSVLPSI